MSEKLVLIDGHSILNRAFYGVPDLTNKSGLHTNAIYGFLNILFKILDEEKPNYLIVAFDVKAKTFRHEMYEEYKATRKPMPGELREQVPVIQEVLKSMNICLAMVPGLEADDVLGTLATMAEKENIHVSLVSGDRDLLQIASKKTKIRIPKTKSGRTEIEDYYENDVFEKYQVTPEQFIELKALMGDTADNIPGVPKVGEKTATKLMVQYKSIDKIYENIEEVTPKGIKETLQNNQDLARISKDLATIKRDAELEVHVKDGALKDFYTKEAYQWFVDLDFKNFLTRFGNEAKEEEKELTFQIIENEEQINKLLKQLEKTSFSYEFVKGKIDNTSGLSPIELILAGESTSDFPLCGVAITCVGLETYYVKFGNESLGAKVLDFIKEQVKNSCSNCNRVNKDTNVIVGFDIKTDYTFILDEEYDYQRDFTNQLFDVKLGAYLLNPNHSEYQIEDVVCEYSSINVEIFQNIFGKISHEQALAEQEDAFIHYSCKHTYGMMEAYLNIKEKLAEANMYDLFLNMEMPLTYVLYEMEKEGVLVRGEELKVYEEQLDKQIVTLEAQIYETVGEKFNINSPKQLGEILFEKMGIPGGKKTKTGYSTAAAVLEKLEKEYPVVRDILEYRGLTKLRSTYAIGLRECIKEDGRIHSSFNQMITATGRISSTEPNLQNIPMKLELGRLIRKVFVPKEGYVFQDADYSQIELRILAHLSGDENMIEAFASNEDIHRSTAAKVFHVGLDEVTDLQRRNAKAVNFGIVYGISAFGLSEDLGISRKEASGYIEEYFKTYSRIKAFLDDTVEQAKEHGYCVTMFNRRRPIPELANSNFMTRQFGERIAMNAPIQGTAADIMKIAMIRVFWALKQNNLESKLLLQVHDELIIETKREESEIVSKLLVENMEQAAKLLVDLSVECHAGNNWYEAK